MEERAAAELGPRLWWRSRCSLPAWGAGGCWLPASHEELMEVERGGGGASDGAGTSSCREDEEEEEKGRSDR